MLYFFAIILPPLAVLLKGKPIAFIFNILLTLLGWFPGIIHAFFIINNADAEKRSKKELKELQRQHKENMQILKFQQKLEENFLKENTPK